MSDIRNQAFQAYVTYGAYRFYITPRFYLVTYQDADFIKIMRLTEHTPGFALLCATMIAQLCTGVRTALREHWAMWSADYNADVERLDLQCKADDRHVLELELENHRAKIKEKS